MGQLLSRVRKKQSTLEALEDLDKEIDTLEEYRRNTEQKRKRLIGALVFYSAFVYIIFAVFSYFYWTADNVQSQALRVVPLVVFPFLIWGLRWLMQWLFRRELESNTERLGVVLRKKKTILNEVKEKETYKKAKEILEKFDPEYKKQQEKEKQAALKVQQILSTPNPNLRQRPGRTPQTAPIPRARTPPTQTNFPSTPQPSGFARNGQQWMAPPGPPLPRPILPRETGVFDKMVDYLVGDGPSNRYALICQRCLSHNGMALKEEFEYLAFRCCYCYTVNPARKIRPYAPRLPDPEPLMDVSHSSMSRPNEPDNISTIAESNIENDESVKMESKDDTVEENPETSKTHDPESEPIVEFPKEEGVEDSPADEMPDITR